MSAGKKQHVSSCAMQAAHDTVSSRGDLGRRFSSRAAVAEQLPGGALGANLGRPPSFVRAVIPFQ
jgi:hypothetical protein